MSVTGLGFVERDLTAAEVERVVREGLAALPVDGRRVLCLIPDGTRTMPMPLLFGLLERELGPRVAALDYLVALGTHPPMRMRIARLKGMSYQRMKAEGQLPAQG